MDEVEQQISILLNLLGGQSADVILKGLPKERAERIRSRVKKYRHTPPDPADVEQVLAEVDRLMRLLDRAAQARKPRQGESEPAGSSDRADAKDAPSEPAFQPSGDPVADLQRLQPLRVAGALATETPRAAAALLASLPSQQAGAIARLLPVELRTQVLLEINRAPRLPRELILKLAQAAVQKAVALDLETLQAEREDVDARLARLLRTMSRGDRTRVLEALDQQDEEAANRVRSKLFSFNDLMGVEDRSLQRVLSEVDLMTLAIALSGASEELRQRVQTNMSRRARETLIEEMELLPNISDEERAAAETRIVQAMLHLDEKGELMFIGGEDVD